jgi:hypothetical protein
MPTGLRTGILALPDPPAPRACPSVVREAIKTRAERNEALATARMRAEELRQAFIAAKDADRDAAASAVLNGSVKSKPTADKIAKQAEDAEEEVAILAAAYEQADERLADALVQHSDEMNLKAEEDVISALVIACTETDKAINAVDLVQKARDHRAYCAQVAAGRNPRAHAVPLSTSITKPNGYLVTVAEALAAAREALAEATNGRA